MKKVSNKSKKKKKVLKKLAKTNPIMTDFLKLISTLPTDANDITEVIDQASSQMNLLAMSMLYNRFQDVMASMEFLSQVDKDLFSQEHYQLLDSKEKIKLYKQASKNMTDFFDIMKTMKPTKGNSININTGKTVNVKQTHNEQKNIIVNGKKMPELSGKQMMAITDFLSDVIPNLNTNSNLLDAKNTIKPAIDLSEDED